MKDLLKDVDCSQRLKNLIADWLYRSSFTTCFRDTVSLDSFMDKITVVDINNIDHKEMFKRTRNFGKKSQEEFRRVFLFGKCIQDFIDQPNAPKIFDTDAINNTQLSYDSLNVVDDKWHKIYGSFNQIHSEIPVHIHEGVEHITVKFEGGIIHITNNNEKDQD